jgi:signal transduction histidine kinase
MFLVQARPWTSIPFDRVIAGMMFVSLIQIIAVLVFTFRVAVMVMAVNIVLMTIPWFVKPEYRVITFPITVICTIFQSVFLAILSKINQSERDIAAQLSAENAVGEILAGIAHGINSPLSAVRTIGARLDRKLGLGELTLDAARVLVIKMLRAVDRTLILSKALQNYVEQVPNGDQKRFDLQMACREATQFCVAAFDLESVKINLDFPESQVLISAPRDRVVHAISSLLSSCYKNLSASSNSEINIGIEVVGCSAVVRVGDTGKASLDALVDTVENPLKHRTGIEKGGDLEIRMARKLFEMCAARFEVGKDPVRDKFRATWELAS